MKNKLSKLGEDSNLTLFVETISNLNLKIKKIII